MKFLTRRGYLIEEPGMAYVADLGPETALGPLQQAACTYRIALGPRAGQKVLSLQTVSTREPPPTPACAVSTRRASAPTPRCAAPPIRGKNSKAMARIGKLVASMTACWASCFT
jgi:hypothetical protein